MPLSFTVDHVVRALGIENDGDRWATLPKQAPLLVSELAEFKAATPQERISFCVSALSLYEYE